MDTDTLYSDVITATSADNSDITNTARVYVDRNSPTPILTINPTPEVESDDEHEYIEDDDDKYDNDENEKVEEVEPQK